jgi:hypothetical protein|tara:strand:- start:256 stop:1101 length:846 start_codon:yes stop_codon:yes gene_type:complete
MAKKATQAVKDIEVAPQVIETKEVAKPAAKVSAPKKPQWEIKDRTYLLNGLKTPLTYTIASRHTNRYPLLWFDKEKNEQRELRYATNQNSPLVDEQSGEATLGHIVFRNGTLTVTKEKQNLQKLLSLYHPMKGIKYNEFNPVEEAVDDLETIEYIIEALNVARGMDIDQAEAILRVEVGSKVSDMSSKEIKRDLLIFAKENAQLFLELANDENVQLRNVAINATELGLLSLSQDQRTFSWAKTNRKIMNVPFDENPYSAMAAFFKTDEGIEVYKSIEKKLL